MKFNISYPANGSQKLIEIDDDRKLRPFLEKRMGSEVSRLCRQLHRHQRPERAGNLRGAREKLTRYCRFPAILLETSSRDICSGLPVEMISKVRNEPAFITMLQPAGIAMYNMFCGFTDMINRFPDEAGWYVLNSIQIRNTPATQGPNHLTTPVISQYSCRPVSNSSSVMATGKREPKFQIHGLEDSRGANPLL